MDRAEIVHQLFLDRVRDGHLPQRNSPLSLTEAGLSRDQAISLFKSQSLSRHLDRTARKMQARGEGFYTIGSSGHEGMAAIALAFHPDDMAFLHYRDAAFLIERAKMVSGEAPLTDMLLSFAASSEDPISGGRHKVLGSKRLFIPPQTSTIASHLPKAMGAAFSIDLARRMKPEHQCLARDGVVMCSFGDASLNHSTAQGALNTACWTAFRGGPMPIVFVCEDNRIGISTKTPEGWIEASMRAKPGMTYFACDGLDLADSFQAARAAVDHARTRRQPAFLHFKCVRLYGHAGSDIQSGYLTPAEVDADESNDPLIHSAALLISEGLLSPDEVLQIYGDFERETERVSEYMAHCPRLRTSSEVAQSLVPPARACSPGRSLTTEARNALFAGDVRAMSEPQHMARLINWALTDLMAAHPEIVLAGEDIGQKGGVYGVTNKLHSRFGSGRVIDTLLDEQSILGLSIGMAHNGFLPIPEIQFLAYVHNAEDQIRGEASTLSFFSNGQFTNPMVIRIAGLGYQKGFGGHFHNDNSLAVLRDIPGLIIACPSNGRDAVQMLRECVRLARQEQRVVVFLEPIARYPTRDLHDEGDGLWAHVYEQPGDSAGISLGEIGQYGDGEDLAIVTYGNGVFLARQAEKILSGQFGARVRIIDLRWLAPLNEPGVCQAVSPCAHILIVDECRSTGSQSEALMALMMEQAGKAAVTQRITADDCFIPLGPAASAPLPNRDGIVKAALDLIKKGRPMRSVAR